jgi:transposase-like protein
VSKQRGRAFWERAFAQVEAGQRPAEVARRLGVSPKTLSWWCWRLRKDQQEGVAVEVAREEFLPVVVRDLVPVSGAVELAVADVQLRVPVGTDTSYVAELTQALRSRC